MSFIFSWAQANWESFRSRNYSVSSKSSFICSHRFLQMLCFSKNNQHNSEHGTGRIIASKRLIKDVLLMTHFLTLMLRSSCGTGLFWRWFENTLAASEVFPSANLYIKRMSAYSAILGHLVYRAAFLYRNRKLFSNLFSNLFPNAITVIIIILFLNLPAVVKVTRNAPNCLFYFYNFVAINKIHAIRGLVSL